MRKIKICLITVTYNAAKTLQQCINSVINQTYPNLEYIIIDGNSNDQTQLIIEGNKQHIHIFKSEADEGIYDAINKGIMLATGDVIGTLNADDYFVDSDVLNKVAQSFEESGAEIVYADLDYVNNKGKVIRKWRSGIYRRKRFNFGWMPPHPTFYAKRALFEKSGLYNIEYGTAADYELMLRFMYVNNAKTFYLNKTIVKMTLGGVSNENYNSRLKAWRGDLNAMKNIGIALPFMCLLCKPLRKISQFL